jgi:hypothetical protein
MLAVAAVGAKAIKEGFHVVKDHRRQIETGEQTRRAL